MGTGSLVLTFVCSLWQGWRPVYGPEHVYRLQSLLKRYAAPHRFVCLTNQPLDCETVPLPQIEWKRQQKSIPNCYGRLWLFSEAARQLGEWVVNVDLDVDMLRPIDELFTGDEDFKILAGEASPYNGSLWKLRTGSLPHIWDDLDGEGAKMANKQINPVTGRRFYGSDQSWLSYKLPNRPVWDERDGVYQHVRLTGTIPEDARMIFYAGIVKPWTR